MTYINVITRYINTIPRARTGLRVLIANDLAIEQLAFLETIRSYLVESVAQAVNKLEFEELLNQTGHVYDLVILEERFLLGESEKAYFSRTRKKYPRAKIALFIDRENIHHLQTSTQLSDIDIILTKCSTVEAIAEKICLMFQKMV